MKYFLKHSTMTTKESFFILLMFVIILTLVFWSVMDERAPIEEDYQPHSIPTIGHSK